MKRYALSFILAAVILTFTTALTACSENSGEFKDGYYTAEMEDFDDHGWKEYITICVSDGEIVTLEYNAKNPSGMIKAWDMDYMRTMNSIAGTYPNEYTRAYGGDLLDDPNSGSIDVIAGASTSYGTFNLLADAVLTLARNGGEQIVLVKSEN